MERIRIKKRRALQASEPELSPINPRFKERLPAIMENICQSLLIIEPEVEKMTVPLKEFLDFLEFEIQKTELRIAQEEWKDRADPEERAADRAGPVKLTADREWLQRLRELRKDFDLNVMTSSVPFIRDMLRRVQGAFGPVTPII
jgi:hypothetical protein